MPHTITTKTVADMPIMSICAATSMHTIGADMSSLFTQVYEYVTAHGGTFAEPAFALAIYHDEQHNPERINVECGFPVTTLLPGTDAIKGRVLPGCLVATITHRGPYETLEKTYNQLFQWFPTSGFTPQFPMREYYLNDPAHVPSEELLTEILWPVQTTAP